MSASSSDDAACASHPSGILKDKAYLVAVPTIGTDDASLLICGSDATKVQRAVLLTMSKFIDRVHQAAPRPGRRHRLDRARAGAHLELNGYDETALSGWDVLQKCPQELIDPSLPPPGSRGIDEILATARTRLHRLLPYQAFAELRDADIKEPVLLIDIRPAAHGQIPGAMIIERNGRLDIATRYDLRVVVFCQEGYTSSLAATSLQDVGLLNATDMAGEFKQWKEEGLPVELEP
ncbi:hypothetical protein BJV78DRAFT_1276632 [Lactifluus subvellereus]|nr:hypothetical protein BJV78DRAFT_1276632 [Lactifluus subvellereus]